MDANNLKSLNRSATRKFGGLLDFLKDAKYILIALLVAAILGGFVLFISGSTVSVCLDAGFANHIAYTTESVCTRIYEGTEYACTLSSVMEGTCDVPWYSP